jgi:hypothetical protein
MAPVMKCTALLIASALANELKMATFDGAKETTATWTDRNDPVMGGASTSTFKVTSVKTGLFNGTCAIVGFLKAPGFAKITGSAKDGFVDVTGYDNIALRVKSSTPDYKGFKVAFAAPGIPKTSMFGGSSYKAGFNLSGNDWQVIEVPLTQFSYDWSGYTGRCDTHDPAGTFSKGQQHYCCDKSGLQPSKPDVCVDTKFLRIIDSLEVWAEGVVGDFNIEIDWIGATKKSLVAAAPSALVSFDGSTGTTFTFTELNDPVMGGKSTGTWSLGKGFGIMDGSVVNVPSLKAPGFIKAAADGKFPDVSAFIDGNLVLSVRTTTPEYAGFRVAFASGAKSPSFSCAAGGAFPFSRGCFKNKFIVPAGADFTEIKIPFNSFSDKWSSATGEQTTTCAKSKHVCPTASKLSKIQRIEFWGEGAAGKLHLEIQSVSAEKAAGERVMLV